MRLPPLDTHATCSSLRETALKHLEDGNEVEALRAAIAVVNMHGDHSAWEGCAHIAARILLDWHHAETARQIAERIVTLTPTCPGGHHQLGLAHLLLGDRAAALPHLRSAVSLSKTHTSEHSFSALHVDLATALKGLDSAGELEAELDSNTGGNGSLSSEYFRALAYFELGKRESAQAILEKLSASSPTQAAALTYELGMCALESRDYDKARTLFTQASQLEPDSAHLSWSMLAVVEMDSGHPSAAPEWARKAVTHAPRNIGYRINLAAALCHCDEFEDAIREYRLVLSVSPDSRVQYSLALALLSAGHFSDAIRELKALYRAGNRSAGVVGNLGVAYANRGKTGDLEFALSHHSEAMALDLAVEHRPVVVLNYARLLAASRRYEDALETLKVDASTWPPDSKADLNALAEAIRAQAMSNAVSTLAMLQGEPFVHLGSRTLLESAAHEAYHVDAQAAPRAAAASPRIASNHLTLEVDDSGVVVARDELDTERRQEISLESRRQIDQLCRHIEGPIGHLADFREIGQALFAALIAGPVRDLYQKHLERARMAGGRLDLRLVLGSYWQPCPWETLYDPESQEFIGASADKALYRVVRCTSVPNAVAPTAHISIVASEPGNLDSLDAPEEQSKIREALEIGGRTPRLAVHGDLTRGRLNEVLASDRPGILHFMGHGDFIDSDREGALALVDTSGEVDWVRETEIADILSGHGNVALVILMACNAARSHREREFSGVGPRLVERCVPAVVAMQYRLGDRSAPTLSRSLYGALARGDDIAGAVQAARKHLLVERHDRRRDAFAPVLYVRGAPLRIAR